MQRSSLALALTLLAAPATALPPERLASWKLTFGGLGPVRIGMTVSEAEKALGVPLPQEAVPGDDEPEGCRYASNALELPDLAFMVIKGRLARVEVGHGPYRTASGARVGDTEDAIRRLYPGLRQERHPYVDGHYLIVTSRDGRRAMIFETDGKVVTSMRAGEREPVGYIEGCL